MYICVCNAITEDEIKQHLHHGDILSVIIQTGAATCCGLCLEEIEEINKKQKKFNEQ